MVPKLGPFLCRFLLKAGSQNEPLFKPKMVKNMILKRLRKEPRNGPDLNLIFKQNPTPPRTTKTIKNHWFFLWKLIATLRATGPVFAPISSLEMHAFWKPKTMKNSSGARPRELPKMVSFFRYLCKLFWAHLWSQNGAQNQYKNGVKKNLFGTLLEPLKWVNWNLFRQGTRSALLFSIALVAIIATHR